MAGINLEQLNVRHLVTLCTLHQTGSMRRTAEMLGRTQPAVSLQIKLLESLLGFDLIDHRRGRLAFTQQGAWLVRRAGPIIADLDALLRESAVLSEQPLRVGLTEDFFRQGMKDLSVLLDETAVDVHVQCSEDLLRQFHSGALDIAVAKGDAPLAGAWRSWRQTLGWAGRQVQRRRGTDGILDLVLLPGGCLYHRVAVRTLEEHSRLYAIRSLCSGWDGVFRSLAQGGVTVVSRDWPGEAPLCAESDLPPLPGATVNLLVARDRIPRRQEREKLAGDIAGFLAFPEDSRLI